LTSTTSSPAFTAFQSFVSILPADAEAGACVCQHTPVELNFASGFFRRNCDLEYSFTYKIGMATVHHGLSSLDIHGMPFQHDS
jgi:hypothetical protein